MSKVAQNASQGKVQQAYRSGATDNMGISSPIGVYIGVVKRNDDNQNMGRLQVYIQDFGGNPDDPESWISVSYASPFAGSTSIYKQGSNVQSYEDTIKSYGMWFVPPDIDARVLVAFANGKIDLGYWFACLYQRGTQVSIPGIGAQRTYDGENIPAAPKNKRDKDPDLQQYVTHKPMYDALKKQGLENDSLRGTGSSSVTRESPSKVMGILTPEQQQFVIDDGDSGGNNRLIRLRTTNGVQLLLDDTGGHIYMISKNGESWIEISADGQIHLYGSKDINIRSETNVNIRADNNVNIEAGNNVNIKAVSNNVQLQAGTDINTLATGDTKITSQGTSNINSQVAHYETAGLIHMNGPAAAAAESLTVNTLAVNQSVTESVCAVVPEHEPWKGHAGAINPVGVGNQQMKKDPAPGQTPRVPQAEDKGSELSVPPATDPVMVDVKTAKTSEPMVNIIKEENGFTPVAVEDGGGESVGFGSTLTEAPVVEEPVNPVPEPDTDIYIDEAQALVDAETAAEATDPVTTDVGDTNIAGMPGLAGKLTAASIKAKGILPTQADSILRNELAKSESAVKGLMTGVEKIPKSTFDGLVSFHNQTGDASYAFVNGEKIDMRPLIQNKEWDRVASLMAADERDRSRRIREAGIMVSGNYGAVPSESDIVANGFKKTNELLMKGKLNQQTGSPASPQQLISAASSYFKTTGNMLPTISFPSKLNVVGTSSRTLQDFIKNPNLANPFRGGY